MYFSSNEELDKLCKIFTNAGNQILEHMQPKQALYP